MFPKWIEDIILQECNVKEIEYVDASVFKKVIKPNFKVLGKRWGPKMKKIAEVINAMSQEEINNFEINKGMSIEIDEISISIFPEDVEISLEGSIPGYEFMTEDGLTVGLDTNLTDMLIDEGITRELINRIQNFRKKIGLSVTDRISIEIQNNIQYLEDSEIQYEHIKNDTLANNVLFVDDPNGEYCDIFEINDKNVKISITKV